MLRYFFRCGRWKLSCILVFLLFFFIYIFLRQSLSQTKIELLQIPHPLLPLNLSSNIRTHDFLLYPDSRSFIEYDHIQIDNIAQSMFHLNQNEQNQKHDYSKPLEYSETIFRSASIPIIWLDKQGDIHWNHAAQYETLNYLVEKQFPSENISICLSRQLFILEQWPMGFFSRHHCFIEHFGQTLYSPSMVLLSPRRFSVSHSSNEDFQNEGILRYYQTISLCSSYINHPSLKQLNDHIKSGGYRTSNAKTINSIGQLLERDESTIKFKYSREIWKFGYDHVPHRRWLFDRNRENIKQILNYHSPIKLLIDHSNEHIYYFNSTLVNLTKWVPRNAPQAFPKDVLEG
jgi:hypothetical protein